MKYSKEKKERNLIGGTQRSAVGTCIWKFEAEGSVDKTGGMVVE